MNKALIFSDEDKQFVRDKILDLVISVFKINGEDAWFKMLLEAITTIASVDLPNLWPEFCEQLWIMIWSADSQQVYISVRCWSKIFKYFGYSMKNQACALLWEKLNERIIDLMSLLNDSHTQEALSVRLQWASTMLVNVNLDNFQSYGIIFKDILYSEEAQGDAEIKLSFKLKNKALEFFFSSILEYGNKAVIDYCDYGINESLTTQYLEPVLDYWYNNIENCK